MDKLSPDARAIYDLLQADTKEAYEQRFLDHKKEILDAVKTMVDDTRKQIKDLDAALGSVNDSMTSDLSAMKELIGDDLEGVKTALSGEIAKVAAVVDRVVRSSPSADAGGAPAPHTRPPGDSAIGPDGHGARQQHRGPACSMSTPPPVGGTNPAQNLLSLLNSACGQQFSDASASAPRVELPSFEGSNPRLWQRRCEEYLVSA